MEKRYPPDDPREWLARAHLNLSLARQRELGGHRLDELAFEAQQAAEKAVKAVFLSLGHSFPYTHNIRELLELLERKKCPVPEPVWEAHKLTEYATSGRYPGGIEAVTPKEYEEAIRLAERVVDWAEKTCRKSK